MDTPNSKVVNKSKKGIGNCITLFFFDYLIFHIQIVNKDNLEQESQEKVEKKNFINMFGLGAKGNKASIKGIRYAKGFSDAFIIDEKINYELNTKLKVEHSPVLPKNSPPAFRIEENKIVPVFDNKFLIIMKTLERFLKRRPTIDVLKNKGIIKGFYENILKLFVSMIKLFMFMFYKYIVFHINKTAKYQKRLSNYYDYFNSKVFFLILIIFMNYLILKKILLLTFPFKKICFIYEIKH